MPSGKPRKYNYGKKFTMKKKGHPLNGKVVHYRYTNAKKSTKKLVAYRKRR